MVQNDRSFHSISYFRGFKGWGDGNRIHFEFYVRTPTMYEMMTKVVKLPHENTNICRIFINGSLQWK